MKLVNVLIEYATYSLDRPFSYSYNGQKLVDVGYRVLIDFNHREIVGYVIKVENTDKSIDQLEKEMGFKIGEVKDVIDTTPLLNEDLLLLVDKMKDYYLASKISILQTMLPPSLSPRRSSLKKPRIAYEKYVQILDESEFGLTNKQIEALRLIAEEKKILKKELPFSLGLIDKLVEAKKIEIIEEEKRRLKIPDYQYIAPPKLNDEQNNVIDEFKNSSDLVYLLQGVTGSGKTEVYLKISEDVLKEGKSVLMLVPEISLTPMMMEYFIRRFNNNVAILHSELTPAEKYDEYRKIARGEAKVVVGARSAIFAPLSNIGLIILDEEHTESYKQDTAPFYHAREVAIMRAKMHSAKVILGSATPSLESRARAQKGVYHLLRLNNRANKKELPKTTIINMSDYSNIDRESYIFSLPLRKEIQKVLDRHEQAILLINRRGYSTSVSCRKCGAIFRCPECGVPLTYHQSDNMLKCHHCDYVAPMNDACPECGSTFLMKVGFGSEKIEEEVKRLFPSARTLRLDSDSAKIRAKIPSIVESFRKKEADILIGTQMIAKGHDFPSVTLVGIVLADIGLSMPSFRSAERAFQLITQAIGRSGRSDKVGQAIIQTYLPSHYAITLAARQDYELFYKKELSMRHMQFYPPYAYLASVTLSGKNEESVEENAYKIVDYLNEMFQDQGQILGPSVPYVAFERDTFYRSILVKYKNQHLASDILSTLIKRFASKSNFHLNVNIDPYNY